MSQLYPRDIQAPRGQMRHPIHRFVSSIRFRRQPCVVHGVPARQSEAVARGSSGTMNPGSSHGLRHLDRSTNGGNGTGIKPVTAQPRASASLSGTVARTPADAASGPATLVPRSSLRLDSAGSAQAAAGEPVVAASTNFNDDDEVADKMAELKVTDEDKNTGILNLVAQQFPHLLDVYWKEVDEQAAAVRRTTKKEFFTSVLKREGFQHKSEDPVRMAAFLVQLYESRPVFGVLVVCGRETFVGKTSIREDKWSPPGGKMEPTDYDGGVDTAMRELLEECGRQNYNVIKEQGPISKDLFVDVRDLFREGKRRRLFVILVSEESKKEISDEKCEHKKSSEFKRLAWKSFSELADLDRRQEIPENRSLFGYVLLPRFGGQSRMPVFVVLHMHFAAFSVRYRNNATSYRLISASMTKSNQHTPPSLDFWSQLCNATRMEHKPQWNPDEKKYIDRLHQKVLQGPLSPSLP
jgi:8-oxo-dGTP pyrophosphatase MutT (NUDIX family)